MTTEKEIIAFQAFRSGWETCLERAGGLLKTWNGMEIDWEIVKDREFKAWWVEFNRVWEAEAKLSEQRVAHNLAKEKPLNVLPIPTAVNIYDDLGRIKLQDTLE